MTLFSGEYETLEVIDTAAEIGVVTLIVLAVVKLFVTSLLLVTGWKGGYIFPTMFAGVALGMAVHLIFPSIPLAVAVAATMAGAMVATDEGATLHRPVCRDTCAAGGLPRDRNCRDRRPAGDDEAVMVPRPQAGQSETKEQEQVYPGPE